MPRKPKAEKRRENIERVALELYHNRLLLSKPGDEHSDWTKAEKIVRSPIRTTRFTINRPLIKLRQPTQQAFKFLAWDTPRWFLFSLPQLEWMKLLAVPLVIAAAGSVITGQIQREANQNAVLKEYFDKLEELTFNQNLLAEIPNAGAIVLARGRTVAALRELDRLRKTQLLAFLQASDLSQITEGSAAPVISFKAQNLSGLDLHQVNLSGLDFRGARMEDANLEGARLEEANLQGAFLMRTNLEGARLEGAKLQEARLDDANLEWAVLEEANLQGASLIRANLQGASLIRANLQGAVLTVANLQGARMERANLQEADLSGANLQGAVLEEANLQGAVLTVANLQDAHLQGVNLEGAVLEWVNLQGAFLSGANLQGAVLSGATKLQDAHLEGVNLEGALNLTQDQLALAKLCRTTLPQGITLDPNRDCEELGVDP